MTINHSPGMDPREPREGDLETFRELEPGDRVTFFEWPVSPLEVVGWEEDETVGECARVEAEGEESYLYAVDGTLWHYVDSEQDVGKNPYPVEGLRWVETGKRSS